MFALNFDFFLKKLFTNRWNLDEEIVPHKYQIPKNHQLKIGEDDSVNIFKYPSHYKHHYLLQYNSAFLGYFSILGSIVLYSAFRMRKKSLIGTAVLSSISLVSFYEGHLLHGRVKDVKYVGIKQDGKTIIVRTFQDEFDYELDVSDIRLTNKDRDELIIFTDKRFKEEGGKFKFFFLEPSYATVVDKLIFDLIFIDRRHLIYY